MKKTKKLSSPLLIYVYNVRSKLIKKKKKIFCIWNGVYKKLVEYAA